MSDYTLQRYQPVLSQSAGEKAALWLHRIVIVLAFLMIFFPPFNPGRISANISGNLTLLTSATSYGTITTKLEAYMVPGLRFALNSGDIRLSMLGCAMVLAGVIAAAVGACMSLGNRRMRRIAVWLPIAGGAVILGGLFVNRTAYNNILAFVQNMDATEELRAQHLTDLALQWPDFAYTVWTAAAILIMLSGIAVCVLSFTKK